jgi:hypothetical protein
LQNFILNFKEFVFVFLNRFVPVLLQILQKLSIGINTEFYADFEFYENKNILRSYLRSAPHDKIFSTHCCTSLVHVLQGDLDQLVQGQKLLAAKLEAMETALRYKICS